jgi:hypothetical protein
MSNITSINEPNAPTRPGVLGGSINEPVTIPEIPEGAGTPVIASIAPDKATIGDPSFTLYITGENFFAASVVVFAGQDEPTTLNEDGTLSTGVNMDVWHGPDVLKVSVRNGSVMSNEVSFTFEGEAAAMAADPDELEDEIEASAEDGDFKPTHRGRVSRTLPHKRK